jgi:D-sedoheptulose 7-phosphate isomerase
MRNNEKLNEFYNWYTDNVLFLLKNINFKNLQLATNFIEQTIKKNKNIYICGNGGSLSLANHYMCDYLKGLTFNTNLKPQVRSLSADNALISAIANDISYDDIFYFQAKKLFKKGDLLILISCSGNSKNIKKVLKYANKINIKSIGFSAFDGGYLHKNSSVSLNFKINHYGISEDINQILMHFIMSFINLKNRK